MGGGAVDDACEGLAGVGVVELVVVGVEDVGGLVGIFGAFAVYFDAWGEAPVLGEFYFVADAYLEGAYYLVGTVV